MNWTEAQLDWARHGVRLLADRLRDHLGMSGAEIVHMRWEMETRAAVLDAIHDGRALPPNMLVMAVFMQEKADLQIARYSGWLDDEGFFEGCRLARERLRAGLRALSSPPDPLSTNWRGGSKREGESDGTEFEVARAAEVAPVATETAGAVDASSGGGAGEQSGAKSVVAGHEEHHTAASAAGQ
jgi:hypothetical protein